MRLITVLVTCFVIMSAALSSVLTSVVFTFLVRSILEGGRTCVMDGRTRHGVRSWFWKQRASVEKSDEALGSCGRGTKSCVAQDHHISKRMNAGRTRQYDRHVGSTREKVRASEGRERSENPSRPVT